MDTLISYLVTTFPAVQNILTILGGVVIIATAVVKLTPSQRDDAIVARIVDVLEKLSLVNAKPHVSATAVA